MGKGDSHEGNAHEEMTTIVVDDDDWADFIVRFDYLATEETPYICITAIFSNMKTWA